MPDRTEQDQKAWEEINASIDADVEKWTDDLRTHAKEYDARQLNGEKPELPT